MRLQHVHFLSLALSLERHLSTFEVIADEASLYTKQQMKRALFPKSEDYFTLL